MAPNGTNDTNGTNGTPLYRVGIVFNTHEGEGVFLCCDWCALSCAGYDFSYLRGWGCFLQKSESAAYCTNTKIGI